MIVLCSSRKCNKSEFVDRKCNRKCNKRGLL
nr:MAG TPA: hypothetical protein [Caudoviricetes sp.]